jgi:hypothetical protein
MLVKPMQTAVLIRQIEKMMDTHAAKLQRLANNAAAPSPTDAPGARTSTPAKKKSAAKRLASKKLPSKGPVARKKVATKKRKR